MTTPPQQPGIAGTINPQNPPANAAPSQANPDTPDQPPRRRSRWIIPLAAAAIAGTGITLWYLNRDTTPEAVTSPAGQVCYVESSRDLSGTIEGTATYQLPFTGVADSASPRGFADREGQIIYVREGNNLVTMLKPSPIRADIQGQDIDARVTAWTPGVTDSANVCRALPGAQPLVTDSLAVERLVPGAYQPRVATGTPNGKIADVVADTAKVYN